MINGIEENGGNLKLGVKKFEMKICLTMPILGLLLVCSLATTEKPPQYQSIKIKEVFSKLITRENAERVYSGQIKTEAGLTEFEETYGINVDSSGINFEKQMLIFGITDSITTRAFQFLQRKNIRTFILDYGIGIEYKLKAPPEGKKLSYVQVFVLEKIEGIPHIRVKNLVRNGLSRVYDK